MQLLQLMMPYINPANEIATSKTQLLKHSLMKQPSPIVRRLFNQVGRPQLGRVLLTLVATISSAVKGLTLTWLSIFVICLYMMEHGVVVTKL